MNWATISSKNWLRWLLVTLIVLMPFHAFLTTWLGASIGYREIWQAWKEVLIILTLLPAGYLTVIDSSLRKRIFSDKINQFIILYFSLHFLLAILIHPYPQASLMGLRNNLLFLVVFILGQITAFYINNNNQQFINRLTKLIIITGITVAAFAVLHALVLPQNFLTFFGYGSSTLDPYMFIQDSDYLRTPGTLGGPNQLGAFLLIPIAVVCYQIIKNHRYVLTPVLVLLLLAQFFSQSRSAWLATGAVLTVLIAIGLGHIKRKTLLIIAGIVIILAVVIAVQLQSQRYLQLLFLHSSIEKSLTQSSNSDRLEAYVAGVKKFIAKPIGYGPGSAGPASFYGQGFIPESYYLQIVVEVGLIGLTLFLIISTLVAKKLYQLRYRNNLAPPFLAAFIGVAIINLFLHAWTDSTLALIWWGVAGIIINKHKK